MPKFEPKKGRGRPRKSPNGEKVERHVIYCTKSEWVRISEAVEFVKNQKADEW